MESINRMEPLLPEQFTPEILDLTADVAAAASRLAGRLHPRTGASLAELVRLMNCYYSNLIEGHNTTPRDIERALADDIAPDGQRRNLQLEARAHIRVQREIDRQFAAGTLPEPASFAFLQWLHREFYRDADEAMLTIAGPPGPLRLIPGLLREPGQTVAVGRHVPPAPEVLPAFMDHFAKRYDFSRLGPGSRIVAMAAAHHRFNFIHPFLDGNGRVSRLMSHAMAQAAGIGAFGLWSVSRGLARGLDSRQEYKRMLDAADTPRQSDYDGRGSLSLRALNEFIAWFLRVCLDQITFMTGLFDLDNLTGRLAVYVARAGLRPQTADLLAQVVAHGQIARGDAPRFTGLKERTARALLADCLADGILASDTPKGPVRLHVPTRALDIVFPELFPAA
ncbi:MAG TPA: Fic family protein [Solidesulfovibrio magneticus]|nr:Fic family protein [Solidesulfovibrio magneticus]